MKLAEADAILMALHREVRTELGSDAPIELVSAIAWQRYDDSLTWVWSPRYWWGRWRVWGRWRARQGP